MVGHGVFSFIPYHTPQASTYFSFSLSLYLQSLPFPVSLTQPIHQSSFHSSIANHRRFLISLSIGTSSFHAMIPFFVLFCWDLSSTCNFGSEWMDYSSNWVFSLLCFFFGVCFCDYDFYACSMLEAKQHLLFNGSVGGSYLFSFVFYFMYLWYLKVFNQKRLFF